jgi:hypothetical protein
MSEHPVPKPVKKSDKARATVLFLYEDLLILVTFGLDGEYRLRACGCLGWKRAIWVGVAGFVERS